MILQILTIKLEFELNATGSGTLITIFSMVFTVISIGLSIVEYWFSRAQIKSEHTMIISYVVDSPYFSNMKEGAFLFKVMFKPRAIVHAMYTLLGIQRSNIERLMPLQLKNGAVFTFFIEYNIEKTYNKIENKMNDIIGDQVLESKFCQIYKQNKKGSDYNRAFRIDISSLTVKKMNPPSQNKCYQWLDTQCSQCSSDKTRRGRGDDETQFESQFSSEMMHQISSQFTIDSSSPSPRLAISPVDVQNEFPSTQLTAAPTSLKI